jgi:hypothetical protein
MTVSNNCDGPAVTCQVFIKAHQFFAFWGLNSTRGQKKRPKKETNEHHKEMQTTKSSASSIGVQETSI